MKCDDFSHTGYAKLMVFDMDSTLIDAETINELARAAGVSERVEEITRRAMDGELDYGKALRMRVRLLAGLPLKKALEAVDKMPLMPGAVELVTAVKAMGYRTAMLSGGFTISAERIGRLLGMDYVIANELGVKDGILTGEVAGPLTEHDSKEKMLLDVARREKVRPEKCIVIGDGANDIRLFERAGYRIAFNSKPVLRRYADVIIGGKDLREVIPVIRSLDKNSRNSQNSAL
ncbi:MAG TPA: phosphoserine phosphatase SerB [Candidatus Methanoperedenaceae archaeon]|nr:phosphoserine phosphatase SerB [Candidatus Methanoperedenaceae archaeon]